MAEGRLSRAVHEAHSRHHLVPVADPLERQAKLDHLEAELLPDTRRHRAFDTLHAERGRGDLGDVARILVEGVDLRGGSLKPDAALKNGDIAHDFLQGNRSAARRGGIKIVASPLCDLYSCSGIR